MSTQLFEGHAKITRGVDAVALPRYSSASDRKRFRTAIARDLLPHEQAVPPPVPGREALSAAMALRPLSAPRPQPPPTISEWSGQFGKRLPAPGQSTVRRNLDDYAQTGLAAYRPRRVVRNPMGWIEVASVGGSGSHASLVPGSTAHVVHVRFNHSGSHRPVGKYDAF